MAEYPYVMNTGRLKKFLTHIQSAAVPPKVITQYLLASGFKSVNDRPIIQIVKFLGFVDSAGIPTEDWKSYRDQKAAPTVLASAIRRAYGDLFDMYPDAYRKDDETLSNFFSSKTSVGKVALTAILNTFKTLRAMAKFDEELLKAPDITEEKAPITEKQKVAAGPFSTDRLTLNINIQLQLPSTDDPKIYENLFAALKKHLFPSEA